MKLIPIVNLEDKVLGIPRPDLAGLLVLLLIVGFGRSFFRYGYGGECIVIVLFAIYTMTKRNLEKKEQSLFTVLWANSRIPDDVAGVFRLKRFMGVHREIKR